MCSPPELERNEEFVRLNAIFSKAGMNVPEIKAHKQDTGWLLLSDFGSRHLEDCYNTDLEEACIQAALKELQKMAQINSDDLEPYSEQRLRDELQICHEWLFSKYLAAPLTAAEQTVWDDTCDVLVTHMMEQPQTGVHRDYHCRNLMWRGTTEGIGILDYQDALFGPLLYDPASLLYDCYHHFEPATIERYLQQWLGEHRGLAGTTDHQIKLWLHACAIQRQLKAIGIFARLHLRDSKSSHLPHVEPVLARIIQMLPNVDGLEAATPLLQARLALLTAPQGEH